MAGPVPYQQASDSPFAAVSFDGFYLEDVEDGILNPPGATLSPVDVLAPGPLTESVDNDDEVLEALDGLGGEVMSPGGAILM